jgi:hypothetical protein
VRSALFVFFSFMLSACVAEVGPDGGGPPDSQNAYRYEGCADETLYCPQDRAFTCAIESIRTRYASCEVDEDCALLRVTGSCYPVGDCLPLAVRVGSESVVRDEVTAEIEAYCANPGCSGAGLCGIAPEDVEAVCHEGSCVALIPAGPS